MEPPETPALTGYSCEDFPFWTTQICLLLRKEEIGQIFSLKLHKRLKEDSTSQKYCQNQLSHPGLSHTEQECQ